MKNISTDKICYLLGEKREIDNLIGPCEYHSFSENYVERVELLHKKLLNDNNSLERD